MKIKNLTFLFLLLHSNIYNIIFQKHLGNSYVKFSLVVNVSISVLTYVYLVYDYNKKIRSDLIKNFSSIKNALTLFSEFHNNVKEHQMAALFFSYDKRNVSSTLSSLKWFREDYVNNVDRKKHIIFSSTFLHQEWLDVSQKKERCFELIEDALLTNNNDMIKKAFQKIKKLEISYNELEKSMMDDETQCNRIIKSYVKEHIDQEIDDCVSKYHEIMQKNYTLLNSWFYNPHYIFNLFKLQKIDCRIKAIVDLKNEYNDMILYYFDDEEQRKK